MSDNAGTTARWPRKFARLVGRYSELDDLMCAVADLETAIIHAEREYIIAAVRRLTCDPNFDGNWRNGFESAKAQIEQLIRGVT